MEIFQLMVFVIPVFRALRAFGVGRRDFVYENKAGAKTGGRAEKEKNL